MTNREAVRSLCNAMANTFYPDFRTIDLVLMNEGMEGDAEAVAKDVQIFKIAVSLVQGFVETSRTENGVSTGIERDAVDNSIRYWCKVYGVDEADVLGESSLRVIEDASHYH